MKPVIAVVAQTVLAQGGCTLRQHSLGCARARG